MREVLANLVLTGVVWQRRRAVSGGLPIGVAFIEDPMVGLVTLPAVATLLFWRSALADYAAGLEQGATAGWR